VLMSGCVYGRAGNPKPTPEYNVHAAIEDAQLVYAAGLPLTIVPLDATTLVRLKESERQQVRAHDSPLTRALECLYRLWIAAPDRIMTLHDQLAAAETARPGEFFGKKPALPLRVDEKGFTAIDERRGKPVEVCLEPKRDAFLQYYISKLTGQRLPQGRQ
jgi:purine nucleosidase